MPRVAKTKTKTTKVGTHCNPSHLSVPFGAAAMGNPPPDPIVLRGHGAEVQCVSFAVVGGLECLLSGDANGDVVGWDLATRRPAWRLGAHPPSSGVLSVEGFVEGASIRNLRDEPNAPTSTTHLLTQGRDGSLKCWRLGGDGGGPIGPSPVWQITTGSFHFCKFATTEVYGQTVSEQELNGNVTPWTPEIPPHRLIAVVGQETSVVDLLVASRNNGTSRVEKDAELQTPMRLGSVSPIPNETSPTDSEIRKLGTVMAVAFVDVQVDGQDVSANSRTESESNPSSSKIKKLLLVGYEEGTCALWEIDCFDFPSVSNQCDKKTTEPVWQEPVWHERVHGDAVTSVTNDFSPKTSGFVSAAADGGVARWKIDVANFANDDDSKTFSKIQVTRVFDATRCSSSSHFATAKNTHGIASVACRDDGKIFATGGWDGRCVVYARGRGEKHETKEKENRGEKIASLKFHDDVVACVAFRTVYDSLGIPTPSHPKYAGWLASGSRDGAIALWPIFPPKTK